LSPRNDIRSFARVSWSTGILVLVALAGFTQAQDPAIDRALREIAASGRYQLELPGPDDLGPDRADPARESAGDLASSPSGGVDLGLAAPASVLLWIVLGVFVVVFGLQLFAALRDRQRPTREPARARPPAAAAPTAPAAAVIPDHERLAAEGRFAAAVHALLLAALRLLAERRTRPFPVAATGREILGAVGGLTAGDRSLVELLHCAERAWFGGSALNDATYQHCRDLFERWRTA
jgi:hypothetical protein